MRLVEHGPLGSDQAVWADIVAEGDPELVAGPTGCDVIKNNVVVVPIGDFDVHRAGVGTRRHVEIVGAEGAEPHDHVVSRDEEAISPGVFGPPIIISPGAVWQATVRNGLETLNSGQE